MKKHKMGEDFVRRWHAESGTKWDVICHSIIVILLTIMLAIIVACFFITWINYEFNAGLLIFIPLFWFLRFAHKLSLNKNVCIYAKYNTYKTDNHSIFDKYVIFLMKHYTRKWRPAPFMCCSFKHFEPEVAYNSFDFNEIKSYGKKSISYDACYLYQCKKCNKYVLALEHHQDKHYLYVPIQHAEDADTYSKEWSYYSMQTTYPILHVIDNKYSWENKA